MSNQLAVIIPKILARSLLVLRGKLVMPRIVNGDYSAEAAKKGDVINVPIPVAQAVTDVTPSNTKPALTDTTPETVAIPLDQWKMTGFHLTDKDMTQIDAQEHFLPMQTMSAVDAIASTINGYLFGLYKQVPNWVGTAATTPFATTAAAAIDARKKLHALKADRANRRFVLDLDAEANALGLSTFADWEKTGEMSVKLEGELGRKYGFDFYSDQQVPTHTKGATGTILVNGAAVLANQDQLPVDGVSGAIVPGDLFTIAGDTTQYTVYSVTALSSGAQTITTTPKLAVAPADNAALTFIATHVVNLAFHRDAFAFAMRPLNESSQELALNSKILSMTDPETGISLRLEVTRVHKAITWEMDALYGGRLVRHPLATRVLG